MALRAALLGTLAVALLALVALGSRAETWSGSDEPRGVPQSIFDYGFTLLVIFGVLLLVAIVWALRSADKPHVMERPRQSFVPIVIVFLLVAWLGYNGILRYDRDDAADEEAGEGLRGQPRGSGGESGDARQDRDPQFQWWVAAVAATGAGAAYVWLRRRPRPTRSPHADTELADELELVLTDTLADLEAEHDPRRAVIRAYARMEAVLAAHGLPRAPPEAPLEYLARVLRELRVRAEAAHALTELFERAKFSQHEIDVAMKEEAISALVRVRDDLKAAV